MPHPWRDKFTHVHVDRQILTYRLQMPSTVNCTLVTWRLAARPHNGGDRTRRDGGCRVQRCPQWRVQAISPQSGVMACGNYKWTGVFLECVHLKFVGLHRRSTAAVLDRFWWICHHHQVAHLTEGHWRQVIIRPKANIGNTLRRKRTVLTRLAVTPPKMNRFEWNLEQYETNDKGRDPTNGWNVKGLYFLDKIFLSFL